MLNEYTSPDNVPVQFAEDLLKVLKEKQKEGETKSDYENRIWEESWHILQNIDGYKERAEEKEDEVKSEIESEVDEEKDSKEQKEGTEEKEIETKREEVEKKVEENQEDKSNEQKKNKGQITLSDFGGDN